jgi:hypothetical protein
MPSRKTYFLVQDNDALREYERSLVDIGGCGNHGCLVVKPVGMATNGPCRCWSDKFVAQRVMVAARRLHTRLRELNPVAK